MKRFIFLVLISTLAYTGMHAQLENRFSIGPRIGANFSDVNSDNSKTLAGLAAGITSTYSINEKSGITIDLLYSSEGYKSGNFDVVLDYLKIPILYNSFFGKLGEAFRPKAYLGFAPGFLLTAKSNDIDIKNQNQSTSFDLVGGLGFNQRVGHRMWLNADLRGFLGLTSLKKTGDVKNRTIQASLGIAYGL